MKNSRIMILSVLLVGLMFVSSFPHTQGLTTPISLNVTVVRGIAMANGNDQAIIDVRVSGAQYVKVTTDENDVDYGNFNQYYQRYYLTFSLNKLRKAQVKVEAFGAGTYAVKYVYIRIQFNPSVSGQETWFDRAHDYARSHSSSNTLQDKIALWDTGWEFIRFTYYQYNSSAYSLDGLTPSQAIYGLHVWASRYFAYYWSSSDVSRTAIEVNSNFNNFNGKTSTKDNYNIDKQDCTSMAAFLSGIATAFGLPSRLISNERDRYVSEHMFVEIYGLEVNNNNGWFVIDPANGNQHYSYRSSYNTTSELRTQYARYNYINHKYYAYRLHFIWGMGSNGWGEGVFGTSRMTYWAGYSVPPHIGYYNNNPWDIIIG